MTKRYVRFQIDPIQNFWSKVEKTDTCWNWIAGKDTGGYGIFGAGKLRGNVRVHRFSWEINVGKIPDGMTIDHLCKNRACVNPGHMEMVSRRLNAHRISSPGATQEQLDLRNSEILRLRSEGKTIKEIAPEMGMPASTIRSVIHREKVYLSRKEKRPAGVNQPGAVTAETI